RLFG
ncbi:polymorphic outer membrane G family domain protein, partial [Chlamydia psittaci 84-8471/1]